MGEAFFAYWRDQTPGEKEHSLQLWEGLEALGQSPEVQKRPDGTWVARRNGLAGFGPDEDAARHELDDNTHRHFRPQLPPGVGEEINKIQEAMRAAQGGDEGSQR